MEYNTIPKTELKVSAIGLGTWVFGGKFWGGSVEKNCLEAVLCAEDCGINLIDTAPVYGQGRSENIVGRAIKAKRSHWIVATKCGLVSHGKYIHDLSPQSIRQELELSLKRLQVEYIDLYQCHWPDPTTSIEKTIEALMSFKKEGKIRYIGLSNFPKELFERACRVREIATGQNEYSLLNRGIEQELFPFLRERSIGLLAYGPLGGGILTGKYKEPPVFHGADARGFFYKYYEGEAFDHTQHLIDHLKKLGKPLNQIAINWVRQQEGVASVLVGCRDTKHVKENVEAVQWRLSSEELNHIEMIRKVELHG